jgi:hypothetical protein
MEFRDGRLTGDRRIRTERRSGRDTRSPEERQLLGERRVKSDRRSGLDRRSRASPPERTLAFVSTVVIAGALFSADVYFFGGAHSTYVLQTVGREMNYEVMQWLNPAFSGV